MRIEEEVKLDYSDVLFRPKRSTLSSRKDVNLRRTYKFKYSNNEWSGIPIIAAKPFVVSTRGPNAIPTTMAISETLSKEQILEQLKQNTISCKEVSFKILGFSLAAINTIFSIILSVIFIKLFINYGKN